MKIRERLIKCGDFSIEREHMTIDTLYAMKCYLILRKAGMNILAGRILFYFLAGGTDAETMRKLKELERKNKDKLCLVSQYETYPAGLGLFMQGDLMYEVMATGLNIKDAQEMTPLEAVKLLENHLHFTLEAEDVKDIDKILETPEEKKRPWRLKKESPSGGKPENIPDKRPEEKAPDEEPGEKNEAKALPGHEKATVPERFKRNRERLSRDPSRKRTDPAENIRIGPVESSMDADYFDDISDRMKYMEYEMQAREKRILAEMAEEEEYMQAISEDEEFLRRNGILSDDEEEDAEEIEDDDNFILDVGEE